MQIIHHGARTGVTGSCHEVRIGSYALLVDCGLFQGEEGGHSPEIEFPIGHVQALLLTHSHIDHIGRLPWLLAAGFRGPIYATEATAAILPLMLEDGLKIHLGLNQSQCERFTRVVKALLKPIPFDCRVQYVLPDGNLITICFRPAGHILGSAYIELVLPDGEKVVFSGDLGSCGTPLLVDPRPPREADTLVLESTYGNRCHQSIAAREHELAAIIERSLRDGGAILIPAFSVGRTQELLFDIENIIARTLPSQPQKVISETDWQRLPVIVDSPLAIDVIKQYNTFQSLWAKEARQRILKGRHPLSFSQCISVERHHDHLAILNRIKASGEPAVIVAASGMCEGGRIMNYLEALLPDPRTDVILVGYQAQGTIGRALLEQPESVMIHNQKVKVNASIHAMSGYSAHADQNGLVDFVAGIEQGPKQIRLVHGDLPAQEALAKKLAEVKPECDIVIAAEERNYVIPQVI